MRAISALLFIALVGGCSTPPTISAPGRCGQTALERLNDASMAGLASGHEKKIFDHAYQGCLEFEKASFSGAALGQTIPML